MGQAKDLWMKHKEEFNYVKSGEDKMPCGATYEWERDETPGFRDSWECVRSTRIRCRDCKCLTEKNDQDYCNERHTNIIWRE